MSEELRVSIDPGGAQELEKLFTGLEKLATSASKLAGSSKSLDALRGALNRLSKSGSAFAELNNSIRALESAVQGLPTQLLTAMKGAEALPVSVRKGMDGAVAEVRSGGARMKSAVRAEVAALQAEYEKFASRKGVTFKVEGLQSLKTSGVSLFPEHRQFLADYLRSQRQLQAALKAMDEKTTRNESIDVGYSKTSLARGSFNVAAVTAQLKAENAAKLAAEEAEGARYQAKLSAMWQTQLQQEAAARAAVDARRVSLARGKDLIAERMRQLKAENAAKLAAEEAAAKDYLAKLNSIRASLAVAEKAANNRSTFNPAGATPMGQVSNLKTGKVSLDIEDHSPKLNNMAGAMKNFGVQSGFAHSAVRGLASGFGAMFLTYGQIVPLLAGAAISTAFMKTVKVGAELEHTMTTIRVLGGETASSMQALEGTLAEIARTGPYGPLEVANAMKVLSLAGKDANEILTITKDVLNLAQAGDTSIEKAADVLVSVTTAFGTGAEGFARAGDVIAKTAAVSKSSVESIGEAFKTASVVNKQFGVSLEDVGVGLAALSNLGINGTAAGVALRNMYVDLSGRTPKVTNELKKLGVEARDAVTGKMKPLITIMGDLNNALIDLEKRKGPRAALDSLSTIFSERGGKEAIEVMDLYRKKLEEGGQPAEKLSQLFQQIADSAGFAGRAAIEMGLTTESQLKNVKSNLEVSLGEAFKSIQPDLLVIADRMQKAFASPEFVAGLQTVAGLIANLGVFIVENVGKLASLAAAWAAVSVVKAAVVPLLTASATGMAATAAGTTAAGVAAGAATPLIRGMSIALAGLNVALLVVTAALAAYHWWKGRNAESSDDIVQQKTIAGLDAETERLERINLLMLQGKSIKDAEAATKTADTFAGYRAAEDKKVSGVQTEYDQIAAQVAKAKAAGKFKEDSALAMTYTQVTKDLTVAQQARAASLVKLSEAEARHTEASQANQRILDAKMKKELEDQRKKSGLGLPPTDPSTGKPVSRFQKIAQEQQEGASWKHFEEAYKKEAQLRETQHKQRMQDIQRDFSDEKALLDNALKNKLISEGTHYAQSLAQTVAAEDRRLNEIRSGYEAQVNLIAENMAKLRAANPDVESQAAASPDTLKDKSKLIQEQAAAYRGLQTDLQKVLGTMKSETSALEDQITQRQRLLSQDLRGIVKAEANEYKELGRSLEVSVQQQRAKLDAVNASMESTAEETVGIKAAAEFENKHADAISKRVDKLAQLKASMADIGVERDNLLAAGVPEDDRRVVALTEAYNAWGVAVDDSTNALARMRSLISQGSGYARLAADAEEARKATLKLRDDISKNLADALMRGTAGFKSLWGGLIDWLKNTFAETVLTPQIKLVMNQLMGIGDQSGGNPLSGIGSLLTNGISDGISGAFTKFAESGLGNKMGLSYGYGEVGQNVATSTAKTAGNALGTIGSGYSGYQLSKGISGGYSVTGGNTLNNIGAAASMYFGPIAGVVTGAINRMFGMKAKELTDTGIKGTLGSDSSLSTFQDWKQKGGLFRSDKKGTETAALSIEQEQTLNVAAKAILKSAADASEALGLSGDAFANFTKDVNISFGKDGSGAQEAINKALTDFANDAIDSALGDSLDPYRRAGESLTDTLSRLGSATKQVDNAFKAMGVSVEKVFGTGLASADLKSQLADQFGGSDALGSALGSFYQNFFSETERTKQGLQLLGDEFSKLGLGVLPKTREEFKQTTLDFLNNSGLRTEADQQTFQSLIRMSESFATLVPFIDEAAKAEEDLAKAREEAAAAAEKLSSMYSSLDGIIGDFLSGDELVNYRAGRVQQKLGEAGISSTREGVLGSTREDIMALWESVGVDGKIAIQEAYSAWNDLQEALSAGARKMEEMYSSLDGVVSDFLSGQDLANYRADRISAKLNAGGIQATREGVLGASKEDIFALWQSLGDEGKITLQELYGDWKEMNQALIQSDIDTFLSGLDTTADELMGAYDEINPKAKNLVQTWRDTTQELEGLKSGLEDILGLKPKTDLEKLSETLAKRDGLNDVISSNKDQIFDLTVSKGGDTALSAMKAKEAELWAEFASTRSPEVASAITKLTLDRIKLEDSLREKANEAQLEALNEQISAAEQLKAVAKEMPKFLLSLKAGGLSNLSYGGRLSAQKQLFEQSLTTGGDVQAQAQAYLQQAQETYGGSTTQYSDIFQEVTAQLEQLGLTGASEADAQIARAQAQIDAITGGADRQIAALQALNEQFGTTRDTLTAEADQQVALLEKQISLLETQQTNQEAAITQAGEAYTRMIELLESLDEATITANKQTTLSQAAPKK